MLKALELNGFKSFADKTRFDFPAGITVIVGPNGSGKSNIVDAIKWVLGEQSAKSLRGKDMADVIFKGSATGGRKVMNAAEATIIFDNSENRLPVDAPEVHVTRRVYRSGEGEYLINQQPCRLRDIRDMFRGTGVGTDAYSLIEQGKVDKLLQASSKDRRAIFEEAAGISRFKAKKIECQRRLDRVDQNLLRLSDIVEEVESRLRSVRSQATKARRYREYSQRLQQLRTHVGYTDWRRLTEQLTAVETELREMQEQREQLQADVDEAEKTIAAADERIESLAEQVHEVESLAGRNREQIAGFESRADHERQRCVELDEETLHHREQLAAVTGRAGDLHQRLRDTRQACSEAQDHHRQVEQELAQREAELARQEQAMGTLRQQSEAARDDFRERTRQLTEIDNDLAGLARQQNDRLEAIERHQQRLDQLQQEHDQHRQEIETRQAAERRLRERVEELTAQRDAAESELEENRRLIASRRDDVAKLQNRRHGIQQRAAVIEEMEQRQEGLGRGARDILASARAEDPEPHFRSVRGLVADILRVSVELAPLIDIALGPAAQFVVVQDDRLIAEVEAGRFQPASRVGFIEMTSGPALDALGLDLRFAGRPGVVGRADQVVQVAPEFQPLVTRLLGDTWFVEDLAVGKVLRAEARSRIRCVTTGGELLDRNGTVVMGRGRTEGGLISRRSELYALKREMGDLDRHIGQSQRELTRLRENVEQQELALRQQTDQLTAAQETLADERVHLRTLEDRQRQSAKQKEVAEAECRAATQRHEGSEAQLAVLKQRQAEAQAAAQAAETALQQADQALSEKLQGRDQLANETNQARVEVARSEQRLTLLKSQLAQLEDDHRERSRVIAEVRDQLAACLQRRQDAEQAILDATSELAELYHRKEQHAAQARQLAQHRKQLADERTRLAADIQRTIKTLRKSEEEQHRKELNAGELRHQRTNLAERLRDDYGIDIAQCTEEPDEEEQAERQEIEEEINSLRRKLNNIGAVNMEALNELDDLESRFGSLSTQHQDLIQAKESLERIIHRINADSRRLFVETLEAIRSNFQVLYRKAFGGGSADLVLEEGVDVLEAGVEIMATPPGKPSFNNSLLSGGEKALTAVALLLSIFQFQPSPFCVLDEVDAPFDEANIGRFVDVLKDFLGWTKFVIVTHSKKTMTAATTLYGVTMQESGVSKQVSVRFEDVTDDGHIKQAALDRADSEDAA